MKKKLFFVSLFASYFIISCSDNNNEILEIENKIADSKISNRLPSQPIITYPVILSVVDASGTESVSNEAIGVNPNYTYYSDYNIYAGDGYYSSPTPDCLGDGKLCINLSHFLAMNQAYIQPNPIPPVGNTGKMAIYFGENDYYNFSHHPTPTAAGNSSEQSYTINEYGSGSPLFNYSSYMTNDAANSVLHQFKDMVATIPNNYQGKTPKIFAAHFQYNSWLSIPAHRQAKMTVRYYY